MKTNAIHAAAIRIHTFDEARSASVDRVFRRRS